MIDALDLVNGNHIYGFGECNDEEVDTVYKCENCDYKFINYNTVGEDDLCPVCSGGYLELWD